MAGHDGDFEGFQKISGATSDYELQVDDDSDTELQAEDAMIYPKEDGNLPNIGYGSKMSCCVRILFFFLPCFFAGLLLVLFF